MKQQFQLVLPVTFTSGDVIITPESSPVEELEITGATRYANRRNSSDSVDLWKYLETFLDAESSLFAWTIQELSGDLKGRTRIIATSASEWCDQIEMPVSLALALGFTSGTISSSLQTGGGVLGNKLSYFDSPNRCKGLWIPEPAEEVFFDQYDFEDIQTVLTSQSPRGGLTSASYGITRIRRLNVLFVRGYSARASYVDADFGNGLCNSTDPNISFEEWIQYWNSIGGSCRLYLDVDDLSSYRTVYPNLQEEYWSRPSTAFSLVSEAPLRYEMDLSLIEEI